MARAVCARVHVPTRACCPCYADTPNTIIIAQFLESAAAAVPGRDFVAGHIPLRNGRPREPSKHHLNLLPRRLCHVVCQSTPVLFLCWYAMLRVHPCPLCGHATHLRAHGMRCHKIIIMALCTTSWIHWVHFPIS